MTSTALLDRALSACRGQPAIVTADGAHSLFQLIARLSEVPLDAEGASGSIAISLEDPLKLVVALLALDGAAERILLVSPTLSPEEREALLMRFGPSAILTDTQLQTRASPVIRWNAQRPRRIGPIGPCSRETKWTLATSGTTSVPKLVEHRLTSLARRTRVKRSDGPVLRWGQLYDPYRFAGVQVLLQGLLGGGALILPPTAAPLSQRLALLARHRCTALSATPTLWRKILMMSPTELQLRQVTLGGEIADNAILEWLGRQYPQARICHIYASTEAGAGFSVADGQAGFPASYLEEPPPGVEIRIRDGELEVKNPYVRPTYVGENARFADDEGFVRTGDIVQRVGNRVEFLGRRSGMINVGGNKLHPEEVERVLLTHSSVSQARVFGRPSPITGQIVAAEVVARQGASDLPSLVKSLRERCRTRLQPWQVPAAIQIVPDLQLASSGKLGRARP